MENIALKNFVPWLSPYVLVLLDRFWLFNTIWKWE